MLESSTARCCAYMVICPASERTKCGLHVYVFLIPLASQALNSSEGKTAIVHGFWSN
jgi:hypothetical protein